LKNPVGKPTKYKEEYNELAYKFCLLGATNVQLAEFFDVTEKTIYNWILEKPGFLDAMNKGKHFADANVAEALYKRALGCSHKETHISNYLGMVTKTETVKHYPPDTGAAFIWLKNRGAYNWKDKHEVEHSGDMSINIGKEFDGA